MSKLKIADDLHLPLDAVTQTFAVMGIRGSGKSHTASVLAEEMLEQGLPLCAYDPTGAWHGLKSSADGKRAGYPIVVFGGEHADVPLEEAAGETIARVIVEKRISSILDVSLLRKGARSRFMESFCEALYRLNREPLHFFIDEAHTIAPQKPFPEVARVLGAVEDIVLQGRRRGLGATIISQRPALTNKNVLTQCSCLVAMRIVGPQDRRAIEDWIDAHGDDAQAEAVVSSLPSLKVGEGWFWSPGWLRTLQRVKFRKRHTFDSSATPEVGRAAAAPKVVAEVDLEALGAEIKATVEKAKADDPRELRRQLAEKSKQVAELERKLQAGTGADQRSIDQAVAKLRREMLDRAGEQWNELVKTARAEVDEIVRHAQEVLKSLAPRLTRGGLESLRDVYSRAKVEDLDPRTRVPVDRPKAIEGPRPTGQAGDRAALTPTERAVLDAAASFPNGATRQRIAVYSGRSIKSSSFQAAFPALGAKGLLRQEGDRYVATQDGLSAAQPNAGVSLTDWLAKLTPSEAKVLGAIAAAYPERLTREQVSVATGQSPLSSSFQAAFPQLRDLELVEGQHDFRASDTLMRKE